MIDIWNFSIRAHPWYCCRYFGTNKPTKQTNFPSMRGKKLFPVTFEKSWFGADSIWAVTAASVQCQHCPAHSLSSWAGSRSHCVFLPIPECHCVSDCTLTVPWPYPDPILTVSWLYPDSIPRHLRAVEKWRSIYRVDGERRVSYLGSGGMLGCLWI